MPQVLAWVFVGAPAAAVCYNSSELAYPIFPIERAENGESANGVPFACPGSAVEIIAGPRSIWKSEWSHGI